MWPPSLACSSMGSRASSTRRASRAFRESASAHLRMSPGGSTPSSSRSCPELPPLSNIVTTALTRSQGLFFRPPSTLGIPVPPPKQPTFNSRRRMRYIILICLRSQRRARRSTATCASLRRPRPIGRRIRHPRARGRTAPRRRRSWRSGHGDEAPLVHTLAVVDSLTPDDLRACAVRLTEWHDVGLATPLLLASRRVRAIARRVSVRVERHPRRPHRRLGREPVRRPARRSRRPAAGVRSAGARPSAAPAAGLHGNARASDALAVLIVQSAPAWAALLQNVARLDGHASHDRSRRGPPRRTPARRHQRRRGDRASSSA